MASDGGNEPLDLLTTATRDLHRAIVSLIEELEAIDRYQQRAAATALPQLTEVLLHNRNEEIEHAAMLLEWIRRNSHSFDGMLRKYLFGAQPIVELESSPDAGNDAGALLPKTLGIGGMKGK